MTHLRRWLPALVAVLATVAIVVTAPRESAAGTTAESALGDQQLRIMAPAAPGGGWDQTSRAMQESLRDLVGSTEVYNVPGAGGTIGLSQFVRFDGDASQLMTTGLIMVGAVVANHSQYSLDDTTPLVRLTSDYEVVVVPKDSKLTSLADVAAAMKANLRSRLDRGWLRRRRRADSGRLDGEGRRRRSLPAQLRRALRRRRDASPRCCRAARRSPSPAYRKSSRRSTPAKSARSRCPARSGWRDCPTCRRCARPEWMSSCRTGVASSRRRASPKSRKKPWRRCWST